MIYACPFNYVGGKSRVLPTLLPLFSKNKDKIFVDLFGGGFSVGLNAANKKIIYNDINSDLTSLLRFMHNEELEEFEKRLVELIEFYKLSKTNKKAYLQLRSDFNRTRDPFLFCLLIFYSFNHQIRYNRELKFNTPFGANRSSYNVRTQKNLRIMAKLMHSKDITFLSKRFEDIKVPPNAIVYADPPYLITTGSYNDGNRGISSWDDDDETKLYSFLDNLAQRNTAFVLSNMLKKGDRVNGMLNKWKDKYRFFDVKTEYKNYHRNSYETQEIVVTNILH
jgi:adenine-specific DNA-methyltransferase